MKMTDTDLLNISSERFDNPGTTIKYYGAYYPYGVTVSDMMAPKHVIVDKGSSGDTGETVVSTFFYGVCPESALSVIAETEIQFVKAVVEDSKMIAYEIHDEGVPPAMDRETFRRYNKCLLLLAEFGVTFTLLDEFHIITDTDFKHRGVYVKDGVYYDLYVSTSGYEQGAYYPDAYKNYEYTIKLK